jgi:tryptophan 2,3-dioxygenase
MLAGGRDENTLLAFKTLSRVTAIQEVLLRSWHVLTTLTPDEFETFRAQVGQNEASGFQSYQYRHLEFLLGLRHDTTFPYTKDDGQIIEKTVDVIGSEGVNRRPAQVTRRLKRARTSPSLYDAVIHHLAQHNEMADCFRRIVVRRKADYAKPYIKQRAVLDSWEHIYENRGSFVPLYHLAEKLIDLESSFRNWRYLHFSTVARVIGNVTGTGKSPGLRYLMEKSAELFSKPIFPELWDVRQKMFDPAGFERVTAIEHSYI